MNREALDKAFERGILGLVLAILVFGPLAMGAVEMQFFLVIQALTVAVVLLWCARLWLKPRPALLWPPVSWAVLAFALYAIARYLSADIEYVARLEMVRVLIYTLLFLAILNNLYRQEHTQIITYTLVFLAMGISGYAIYQFVTGSNRVWFEMKPYPHRGSGTYISPNNLAGFLEMILPLGLAWTLVSRARAVTRVFLGYASLVILAGIAATVSRGSWAATALMLVIFFGILIFHRTYRIPSLVLLAALLCAGVYSIPRSHVFRMRFRELTEHDQFNDDARFDLWRPAIQMWTENVWWGVGPNHYDYRFRAYRPETEQRQPDRVHNDYLNTLTDWGVAGAALVIAALAALWAGVVKTWRAVRPSPSDLGTRNSNKFATLLGASLGLIAISFHSFVDFNMHIPANAILAITLMAVLSSSLRFASDQYWIAAHIPVKVLATLVLLAGCGYLSWQGSRCAREELWLTRAQQAPELLARQAALERAYEVEPKNARTAYAIGEAFRVRSWDGGGDYFELATNAMAWFKRTTTLNPYDGYGYMGYGRCLDWLEQTGKAGPYFDKALRLDPNGYFTAALVGWHYFQTGDLAAARVWFERSKRLGWNQNPIADTYTPIVIQRMFDAATNTGPGALLQSLPRRTQ